jgi:hypothetical protein
MRFGLVSRGLLLASGLAAPTLLVADPVAVRFSEGLVHGFLKLSAPDGTHLADGDLLQKARGNEVTSRLVFRFKDGSVFDETTVYTQRGHFRLKRSHLVQKGPSFPQAIDATIDVGRGRVTVRHSEKGGEEKSASEEMKLPPDLANGLILTLLKNVSPKTPKTTLSMIAFTPRPLLVKLDVTPSGEEAFTLGHEKREAQHYVIKVDIEGLKGILATILGKEPPDSHVWIMGGEAPAFVKSESPFYTGAPLWRIELVSPVWK